MSRTTHRRRLDAGHRSRPGRAAVPVRLQHRHGRHRQRAAARASDDQGHVGQRRPRREGRRSGSPVRPPTTAGSRPSTARRSRRPRSTTTSSSRRAEGTNDANQQISQVETFINDKVDAIVLLPTDGAALTDVATKAMEAGIPVVNVDREFSSPFAARTTVLGDNYGMGVSAGTYACQVIEDKGIDDAGRRRDRRHRRAAADPGPLEGLQGRAQGLWPERRQPGRRGVHRRVR